MVHHPPMLSAAILAGGQSTRMKGKNKGLVELDGIPLVKHVATALEGLVEEVFIITRSPRGFSQLGHRIVLDRFDHRCSLTGIHAALDGADTDFVFVSACDTPFLQPALVQALIKLMGNGADVIVPMRDNWYFYPLCAIYSKRCLPIIEAQLEHGEFQTIKFFNHVNVGAVPLNALLPYDPTLRSLFNINTLEELNTAKAMLTHSD